MELDPATLGGPGSAALVRFKLPTEKSDRPGIQLPSRLHGKLVLAWKGTPGFDRCQLPSRPPEAVARAAIQQEREDDAESFLQRLAPPSDEPGPAAPSPPGSPPFLAAGLPRTGPLGEPLFDDSPVLPGQIAGVAPASNDRDEFFPPEELQPLSSEQRTRRCREIVNTPQPADPDARERLQEKREYCQELRFARSSDVPIGQEKKALDAVCAQAAGQKADNLSEADRKRLQDLQQFCGQQPP